MFFEAGDDKTLLNQEHGGWKEKLIFIGTGHQTEDLCGYHMWKFQLFFEFLFIFKFELDMFSRLSSSKRTTELHNN